jgi:XRE family transcriptional regulator, regulator of sulfur utilization
MRITGRELLVAVVAAGVGWAAHAADMRAVLGPATFDWHAMTAVKSDTGETRQVIKQPTATLDELEVHVSTLKPGIASHPPHKHPNEELVLVDQGTVETLSGGKWVRLGPGSVIFNASNSLHALRNIGPGPAQYHVVNWTSPLTPKE